MATRASWSPATDSNWASQSARNSVLAKTWPYVGRTISGAVRVTAIDPALSTAGLQILLGMRAVAT
jgi:hypothetical protein